MTDKVLSSVGGGVGGALGGALISSLLGSESPSASTPAPPVPEEPKTMPTPNDAAVRQAKKRSIAAMRARKGRASTILTSDTAVSDALGG